MECDAEGFGLFVDKSESQANSGKKRVTYNVDISDRHVTVVEVPLTGEAGIGAAGGL